MSYASQYNADAPSREEIDQTPGPLVLEFGTGWCGFCQAAQADIAKAFESHPETPHLKVEDGKGRRLGRTFGVKLWPTIVFLRDGQEVDRVVRPSSYSAVEAGLDQIS
ncbi:thioredoxin 1 [Marinobacter segnicrescens]|uniref:Thioredoxin 1 n=1 Tax=Marinobacter segnicrescens TaxID=430453 RepID=A0A1H9YG05_9GAMM|nr:thioredoxin family protein [Marinobacter segnicrescens]SES67878.1 thioredoxin 1 [Marinobacter segnicrescens]